MKRGSMFALLGMLAVAGGCAAPAHYVEGTQKSDSGVVAVPDNSNTWPFYNMKAAKALIEQHVGPNFEIIDQYQAKTSQTMRNDQQTNTDPNKRNPNQTSSATTTTGITSTQDTTEWRIVYKRVGAPQPIAGNPNVQQGAPINGVAPAGGFGVQGGPPSGTVPSVLPVSSGGSFR